MPDGDYEDPPPSDNEEPEEEEDVYEEQVNEEGPGALDEGFGAAGHGDHGLVIGANGEVVATPGRRVENGMTILFNDKINNVDYRTTDKYMTRFERTRLLGTRAHHISENAPIMVDRGDLTDPHEIAEKEMRAGKIPLTIRRILPCGTLAEDWDVDELLQRERLIMNPRDTEILDSAASAPRGVPVPAGQPAAVVEVSVQV